ncbi:MAG TPA: hypothetical protein VFX89_21855 [Gammaproteobacteria bacterium]|nr:hypothetical protein [Gammaproteobacteria bacterium]
MEDYLRRFEVAARIPRRKERKGALDDSGLRAPRIAGLFERALVVTLGVAASTGGGRDGDTAGR